MLHRNKNTKEASKSLRKGTKRRAIAGAITGLSAASLLAVPQADAAAEIMQLAASETQLSLAMISNCDALLGKSACMMAVLMTAGPLKISLCGIS